MGYKPHAVTEGHMLFESTIAKDPYSFYIKGGATCTWEDEHNHSCWEGDHTIPRLIQTDQGFYIKFKWCTYGCLVNALCGKWCLEILFEKKGGGEFDLPLQYREKMIDFEPCDGYCYDVTCHIPPKVVESGLYDICVCITLKDVKGRPLPVASFGDLGTFRFYDA